MARGTALTAGTTAVPFKGFHLGSTGSPMLPGVVSPVCLAGVKTEGVEPEVF